MHRSTLTLFAALLPWLLLAQTTLFVDSNASGSNTGQTWADAFTDLQAALTAAVPGDQIWVAEGVYKPTGGAQRDISFVLKQGVAIYGGFSGLEISFSERNPQNHVCVLSGDIGVADSLEDNSFHILYAKSVDSTAVLDGFVIRDGYGANAPTSNNGRYGAGMLLFSNINSKICTPAIKNCVFTHCRSETGGAVACIGAGGNKGYVASPSFTNCVFSYNRATYGACIYKDGHNNPAYSFRLTNCVFTENHGILGGVINFADADPEVFFSNCKFERDSSSEGGCLFFIYSFGVSKITVENSSFSNNSARSTGGTFAIYNFGADSVTLTLTNVLFSENTSLHNEGGAISFSSSSIGSCIKILANTCTFIKNKSYSPGAAMEMRFNVADAKGFIELNNCCFIENSRFVQNLGTVISTRWGNSVGQKNDEFRLKAVNCLFIRNHSVYNALTPWESKVQADFINCTFYNNGMYPFNIGWRPSLNGVDSFNIARFSNCIVWETRQPEFKKIFNNNNFENYSVHGYYLNHCILSHPDSTYNNVNICQEGVLHGVWPEFIDTTGCTGFGFPASSPAFNAGLNVPLPPFDFIGNDRIHCDTVDLGGIETQEGCMVPVMEPIGTPISVSPNPAGNFLNLNLANAAEQGAIFILYDRLGREASHLSLKESRNEYILTIAHLPPGLYTWVLKGKQGNNTAFGKILIAR